MNVFKSKTAMPTDPGNDSGYGCTCLSTSDSRSSGAALGRVTMTPGERRELAMANYPRYGAMDVKNITRPRFGHGY